MGEAERDKAFEAIVHSFWTERWTTCICDLVFCHGPRSHALLSSSFHKTNTILGGT